MLMIVDDSGQRQCIADVTGTPLRGSTRLQQNQATLRFLTAGSGHNAASLTDLCVANEDFTLNAKAMQ